MSSDLLAAEIELVEATAWARLQRALPPEFQNRYGIQVRSAGSAIMLLASRSSTLTINRVIGLGLHAPLEQGELDAVVDTFVAAGVERFVIQWSPHAEPAHAPEWFANRGYRLVSSNVKLYRRATPSLEESPDSRGFVIEEIGPAESETFERIDARPLGVPDGLGPGVRSAVGHAGWKYYLVFDQRRPIAGAALFVDGEHAWCGLAATIESDRRRGAQAALLTRRLNDAAALGCKWVSADTIAEIPGRRNQSYHNMLNAGFSVLYERPNYLVTTHSIHD